MGVRARAGHRCGDAARGGGRDVLGAGPSGVALEESVIESLRPRQLLWVVDNCEHLVEPTARLVDRVLRACPGVRVLATSREALDLDGEATVPIRSMALAASDDAADVAQSDAARLFAERAATARPGFVFDAANATPISEVCRRLDGIPLAIELAASRVASLGVAEILALLDERFRLLTGGRRIALERHQTLRAAVDWSYSLLDDAERTVFARLAVFPGSFDTRAARAVVADATIDEWAVLDALDGLVRKSMLALDEQPDASVRYQLLETMRQYGRERLEEMGESDTVRRRHAEHFVVRSEEMGQGLMGPDELAWRAQLQLEVDNIRAVAAWAIDVGDVRSVLRLIVALNEEQMSGVLPIGAVATPALEPHRRAHRARATRDHRRGRRGGVAARSSRGYPSCSHSWATTGPTREDSNARVLRLFTTSGFTSIEESRLIAEAAREWDFDVTSANGATATERSHRANACAIAAIERGRRRTGSAVCIGRDDAGPAGREPVGDRVGGAGTRCIHIGGRARRGPSAPPGVHRPRPFRRTVCGIPGGSDARRADRRAAGRRCERGGTARRSDRRGSRARAGRPSSTAPAGMPSRSCSRSGDTEAALVLVGAVIDGELRGLREMTLPPGRTRPDVRALRAQVGKERFAELLAIGAQMPYEDLLDHILTSLRTATSEITP